MDTVNVRQLKNNPSEALRSAASGPVLVLKGDHPEALILHLGIEGMEDAPDVKLALASALFGNGALSLGRAARVAGVAVSELITHLSRLGIPVIEGEPSDVAEDLESLEAWLASS
jgi:predicted HTH domain antitoxin